MTIDNESNEVSIDISLQNFKQRAVSNAGKEALLIPELLEVILLNLDTIGLGSTILVNRFWSNVSARILYGRPIAIPLQKTFIFVENLVFNDQVALPYTKLIRSLAFDVRILGPNIEEMEEWIGVEKKIVERCGNLRELRYLRAGNLNNLRFKVLPLQIGKVAVPNQIIPVTSLKTLYIDTYLTREFPLVYLANISKFLPERLVIQGMRPSFIPVPFFAPRLKSTASTLCENLQALHLNVNLGSERLEPFVDWMSRAGPHSLRQLDVNVFDSTVLTKIGSTFASIETLTINTMFLDALEAFTGKEKLSQVVIKNFIFPSTYHQTPLVTVEDKRLVGSKAEAHIIQALKNSDNPVDVTLERLTFQDEEGNQTALVRHELGWE